MHVVHLTASTFFGGPERQMLGLAEHLPEGYRTSFVSFQEGGRCAAFLDVVRERGFTGHALQADFPRIRTVLRELTDLLKTQRADVLLTHSYKPNILGRIAARRLGIPIVGVSRGWTGENLKVRLYEKLDRWNLKKLDHIVAVSQAQADKVLAAGVLPNRVTVVHNSARLEDFTEPSSEYDARLHSYFAAETPISHIVVSGGRLSPEKGFGVLVEAAATVIKTYPTVGFIHFGDGVEREKLQHRLVELGIADRFILAGLTAELDRYLPWADLVVLPSYTEGLPNIVLEACAAGVAVVATRAGGTPEIIDHERTGLLVPPGDSAELARGIVRVLRDDALRQRLAESGRQHVEAEFAFARQAELYSRLFTTLTPAPVLLHQRVTWNESRVESASRSPSTT